MGRPAVPTPSLATVRLLQTSCGLLTAASLVALGIPAPGIVAHDGAATVASAHPAVPTEWSGGGPLAIPTIGVVPPGTEDWFDPTAEPAVRARPTLPAAATLPSVPETSARETLEPSPVTPAPSSPVGTASASTTEAPHSAGETPTSPTTTPPVVTHPAATSTGATSTGATSTGATSTGATSTGATSTGATSPTTTAPSTTTPSTTTPSTTTPGATPSATPTRPAPRTNERGNVVLAFGDELSVFDGESGAVAFAIAVDAVDADVACAGAANPQPTNGHLVAVRLRVTTGPDLSAVGGEPTVRAADFRVVGPDGGALVDAGTPSAASCEPGADAFPAGPVTAGQERTGVVVLDVPATTGTLVFAPDFLSVGAEWTYGPPAAE